MRTSLKKVSVVFISILLLLFLYVVFTNFREVSLSDLEYLYSMPYPMIESLKNPSIIPSENIAIIIVLSEGLGRDFYEIDIDSVECYAKAHGYKFILTNDIGWGCDHLKVKYFRRHCVIAKILPQFDAILHLDADIGVVNPKKRIQDYLDENIDLILYDRYFSPEIAIGSYIARNTSYALDWIIEFSEYEKMLPDSFHGTENGALHMFLAEKLFPHSSIELELCRRIWRKSKNFIDLFTYTSCIRSLLGASTNFDKLRILRKGTGHVRDDWLTSGVWSPERDFMLHGWKMNQLATTPDGIIEPVPMSVSSWYNPFIGNFHMNRCTLGNTTWNYDQRLIGTREAVEYGLREFEMKAAIEKVKYMSRLFDSIKTNAVLRVIKSFV